jgi:hypothetical protein
VASKIEEIMAYPSKIMAAHHHQWLKKIGGGEMASTAIGKSASKK